MLTLQHLLLLIMFLIALGYYYVLIRDADRARDRAFYTVLALIYIWSTVGLFFCLWMPA